jgi:YgiT-type zinc finger domain-containing protein
MNCVICKATGVRAGVTTVTLERGSTIVIIKEVPAEICDSCGEYYLAEDITERVISHAEGAAARNTEVEIIRFAA